MAIPRIQPFDPSPYTRAMGQSVATGVAQIGSAFGSAVRALPEQELHQEKMRLIEENKMSENSMRNYIIETQVQEQRESQGIFRSKEPEPIFKQPPPPEGVPAAQLEEGVDTTGVQMVSKEDFTRMAKGTGPKAHQTVITPEESRLRKRLTSELKGLSKKELLTYMGGYADWRVLTSNHKADWGSESLTFKAPSVNEVLADPDNSVIKEQIKKFEEVGMQDYVQGLISEFNKQPGIAERIEAAKKGEGAMPAYNEFSLWAIENKGINLPILGTDGQPINDPEKGASNNKLMRAFGDAKSVNLMKSIYDTSITDVFAAKQKAEEKGEKEEKKIEEELDKADEKAFDALIKNANAAEKRAIEWEGKIAKGKTESQREAAEEKHSATALKLRQRARMDKMEANLIKTPGGNKKIAHDIMQNVRDGNFEELRHMYNGDSNISAVIDLYNDNHADDIVLPPTVEELQDKGATVVNETVDTKGKTVTTYNLAGLEDDEKIYFISSIKDEDLIVINADTGVTKTVAEIKEMFDKKMKSQNKPTIEWDAPDTMIMRKRFPDLFKMLSKKKPPTE